VSFDRIARPYRLFETIVFGAALQRARTHWIGTISPPKHAVILGEGDGRFLGELVAVHPETEIDCVDGSPRMLERARRRLLRRPLGSGKNVQFLQKDIRSWTPPRAYDLVVTHFFLDCFPGDELEQIVEKTARAAGSGAVWLVSDFVLPAKGLPRLGARVLLTVMYAFFRVVAGIRAKDLIDPAPYLERNGFVRQSRRTFYAGMVTADLWERRRT
jgi:ubiquinone/menaquinone biosynthesis C-methylase UbiE